MENENYTTEIIKDQNTKSDLFAKVEVVGDLEVGKTSILKKITQNEFIEDYTPTLGYEFNPYLVKVNDIILKLQIWDMCGNENYRSVLLNLYRNASLGILVYSVTSRESFNNLEKWITELKKYAFPGSKIFLLGNKCDDEEYREVSYEEGKEIFCYKGGYYDKDYYEVIYGNRQDNSSPFSQSNVFDNNSSVFGSLLYIE